MIGPHFSHSNNLFFFFFLIKIDLRISQFLAFRGMHTQTASIYYIFFCKGKKKKKKEKFIQQNKNPSLLGLAI